LLVIFNDIKIFWMGMLSALDEWEQVIAGDVYEGKASLHIKIPKLETDPGKDSSRELEAVKSQSITV
jgi:hypothetical protein